MTSLYAYFGVLGLHAVDSPGHALYQVGLLQSIKESFNEEKFDFYSFYSLEELAQAGTTIRYPNSDLGKVFEKYCDSLMAEYCIELERVMEKIDRKEYSKIYLKARFRNLSALEKKRTDAYDFERMLQAAVAAGYSKEEIVILDTDLSLSESFCSNWDEHATFLIPSIHFPGISSKFLKECIATIDWEKKTAAYVFYGNIDTANYKKGNEKSPILNESLKWTIDFLQEKPSKLIVICKKKDFFSLETVVEHIDRSDREKIWEGLQKSTVMLNVTKEKYNAVRFIPARIYEALIFGMIPVSYGYSFLNKAFSFNSIFEFSEIIKYLDECSMDDLKKAFDYSIKAYFSHVEETFKIRH